MEDRMPAYSMLKAKTELSRLVEQALRGEEVVITRDGVPVARLIPVQDQARPPAGLLRSRAKWTDDAFSPDTDRRIEESFGHDE
jgi:prevent-host-death family protein